ncbi:MAG: ATP-binding protein, partial [Ruthenibacterium sp.]
NGGQIIIDVSKANAELVIVVHDNGVGMQRSQVDAILLNPKEGSIGHTCIGVRNVDKRLRLHYGEHYGLEIESMLGIGTTVTLHIPQKGTALSSQEKAQ